MPVWRAPDPDFEIWDISQYNPLTDNMFGYDILHQDEYWIVRSGEVVRLADMSPSHRGNLLRFLRKRARGIEFHDMLFLFGGPFAPRGEMAQEFLEREMELRAEDPLKWLNETKLVKRLAQLVEQDELEFQQKLRDGTVTFSDV